MAAAGDQREAKQRRSRGGGGGAAAAPPTCAGVPSLYVTFLLALASLACSLPVLLHLRSSSAASCLLPTPLLLPSPPPPSFHGSLLSFPLAWNLLLPFPSPPPSQPLPSPLRLALFVKKWPFSSSPGGLERHALTLHRFLADRGHSVHIFTSDHGLREAEARELHDHGLHFHLHPATPAGKFRFAPAWEHFLRLNASRPFDVVHTESVALPAHKAAALPNVVVSWHGIAYEIIHSDIVQDLNRKPGEARSPDLQKRISMVAEEVKVFPGYAHHVATSDYVGDVLRTIYEIVPENVHIILNGVDEQSFRPDQRRGSAFRANVGIPTDARLVLGAAGRLVRDKGYPLLFEAFSEVVNDYRDVYLLIAGDGPWAARFKNLSSNVKVLGPLTPLQLADFYNALDIFVNPTLRAQGMDHTLLEAMLCGKPLLATHFSSITRSVIVNEGLGYTFSPNAHSLLRALRLVIEEGKETCERKGTMCLQRASLLFTATKMGLAYERLFLCIKDNRYCMYPDGA